MAVVFFLLILAAAISRCCVQAEVEELCYL